MVEKLWNSNYLKIWTVNFLIHFSFTLIVPLLPLYLSERFGASKDMIGLVLSGYTLMALMVRPFSGFMVDRFPRRVVLMICSFVFFALFAGYLVAGSIVMFAIFRTLHGGPFGAFTVAASTVAIDVLPSSRRTEGIGYYGLSNNIATVIGPILAIYVLQKSGGNYQLLFALSLGISLLGVILCSLIHMPKRDYIPDKSVISLDRFFLIKGLPEAVPIICFAFSYGIVSTYVAIYGKEELGMLSGTGIFFTLFAVGLIVSRLTGARSLRENKVTRNASIGVLTSLCGFLLFALVHNKIGYYGSAFIIGLGNGHMYPAFLNMFINLAENNQRGTANSSILTSWDAGIGLGVLTGGLVCEMSGYHASFWIAAAINAAGVLIYFLKVRAHFEKNKLR